MNIVSNATPISETGIRHLCRKYAVKNQKWITIPVLLAVYVFPDESASGNCAAWEQTVRLSEIDLFQKSSFIQ